MNHVGAGTLTAAEVDHLATCLGSIVRDLDTSATLTVSTALGTGIMDPVTGLFSASETQDIPVGWTAPLTLREIAQGGSMLQTGDRRFILMAADLTTAPTSDPPTRITHNSITYRAIKVEQDPLGQTWHVIARRID